MDAQSNSVGAVGYGAEMDEPTDIKTLFWGNVLQLMHQTWGKENITGFGKKTHIAPAGAQRIKALRDTGLEIVERIATEYKIDPWQLLAPNLGLAMRLTPPEVEALRKMREPTQPKPGPKLSLASAAPAADPPTATKKLNTAVKTARTKGTKHGKRNKNK